MTEKEIKEKKSYSRKTLIIIAASVVVFIAGIWLFSIYTTQNTVDRMFQPNAMEIVEVKQDIISEGNYTFKVVVNLANNSSNKATYVITNPMINFEGDEIYLTTLYSWSGELNPSTTTTMEAVFRLSYQDFIYYKSKGAFYFKITMNYDVQSEILFASEQRVQPHEVVGTIDFNRIDA